MKQHISTRVSGGVWMNVLRTVLLHSLLGDMSVSVAVDCRQHRVWFRRENVIWFARGFLGTIVCMPLPIHLGFFSGLFFCAFPRAN
jgi:hypothetical protein